MSAATACGRDWSLRVDPKATHRNPGMWGPSAWALLLDAAAAADEDVSGRGCAEFLGVLRSLRTLLPCSLCRDSYAVFVASLGPREAASSSNCVWLVWSLKNLVNAKLSQASPPVPLADVYACLEKSRRSTSFDRALLRGVLVTEAEHRLREGKPGAGEYAAAIAPAWRAWMDLADRRAGLPPCTCSVG